MGKKKINDTYGHKAGDQLLEAIVRKLNSVVGDTDLLCRLGGDEFVILCSNTDNVMLENMMSRIQDIFKKPLMLNNHMINVSTSIGFYYTTNVLTADLEKMINEADRDMYRAKGNQLITD